MPVADRFWGQVDKSSGGCWLWLGKLDRLGYARFRIKPGSPKVFVHRWAFEACIGTIPAGFEVDHLCSVRNCVRPEHLDAVSKTENIKRMWERRKRLYGG